MTTGTGPRVPGPRREYIAAFDGLDGSGTSGGPPGGPAGPAGGRELLEDDDVFAAGAPARPDDPYAPGTDRHATPDREDAQTPVGTPEDGRGRSGSKGRTFTGIAAAAVTTVLAVVVAGQVAEGPQRSDTRTAGRDQGAHGEADSVPGSEGGTSADKPAEPDKPAPLTYDQKMAKRFPLAVDLKGSGEFEAIGGFDKAPGQGQKFRYRIDVEKGLGLDGQLFAEAVQKTLNDERSWAHGGGRTFERISSGQPDFVITLASPGTTADWCAKSGLDTTEDNVSCDSAATDRVMINAWRWAQGAKPYGDAMLAYRQMLINHEVGHRLGFNHETCTRDGALAPVMQQQTKFLEHNGIKCRPNPWAFPGN
ncbi:DUF3152 domain-containing protein [Streptomyces sp. NPDC002851]